ncbi:uncharacterized protein LOC126332390 [Schistocerca gregaria]|uniref:uncharacterized protein LOC126332390 n=1 Tax=Schistocerca gregaria TaxID=7010 RepID=UPI00211EB225|nr:uncharacterized protein LOC126332390 [Schistocerca gregaria]
MVKSFSIVEIEPSVFDVCSACRREGGVLIRIPSSWVPMSVQGAICASNRLMSYGTEKGSCSVVVERVSSIGAEEYVGKVVERLDASRIEVTVVSFSGDPYRRRVLRWNFSRMGKRCHRRLLVVSDGRGGSMCVFCSEDQKQSDEFERGVVDMVVSSFHMLPKLSSESVRTCMGGVPSMKALREWDLVYKLGLRVGFYFDPKRYYVKLDGVPMTDASFYLVGTDETNSEVSFSVFFKAHVDKVGSFESITNDVMNNLNALSNNSIAVVSREDSSVGRMRAHTLVCQGTAAMFQMPERLYFVYKIVIDDDYGVSVLVAFMARPGRWESEWRAVDTYVRTLHRVPDEREFVEERANRVRV